MTAHLESPVRDRPFLRSVSYASCWEDPLILQRALQVQPGNRILSIASGGCNTLSLLLHDPAAITMVDMNPAQLHLVRLKMAAIRTLDHAGLLELVGVRDSLRRQALYQQARSGLDAPDQAYWDANLPLIEQGLFRIGRTDRYMMIFGKLIRTLFGRRKIERLFATETLDEQRRLFHRDVDGVVWRTLFKLFFHRAVISRAKDPTHFRYVDFDGFGDRFRKRTEWLFTEIPIKDNYFLSLVFLGRYWDERSVPPYLLAENQATMAARLDRIQCHLGDLESLLAATEDHAFDRFNLSNLFDWVDDEHLSRMLGRIVRSSRPGARLCYWNTLMPRPMPAVAGLKNHADDAAALLQEDRFIYAHFTIGEVPAEPAGVTAAASTEAPPCN